MSINKNMDDYKTCTKCKEKKLTTEFSKDKQKKSGISSHCRLCCKLKINEWIKTNKLKISNHHKIYYIKNKDKIANYTKTNADEISKRMKIWRKKNKDKILIYKNRYEASRKLHDINYRLLCNMRNRLRIALINMPKHSTTTKLIGCSIEYLKIYLESKFQHGMGWDNYGKYGWHVDHIIPCCNFDFSIPENQYKCFHYSNLQPLWAIDNIRKGSKL